MTRAELFAELCAAESYRVCELSQESGIGIYNEKRLHRILKRTFCQNENCFEVGVGRYVADILEGSIITEIQCGPFAPLRKKLEYYLNETDYSVRIVHPIIVRRMIIRAERETGEIARVRTSPKRESVYHALADLYPLGELLPTPRVTLELALIEAEEFRYSERMRYRKKGAYDSELFPTALTGVVELCSIDDYSALLPEAFPSGEFSASDVKNLFKLTSRQLYSMLNTLCDIGALERSKQGRCVKYNRPI